MSCAPGQSCCDDCQDAGLANLGARREQISTMVERALDDLAQAINVYAADYAHDSDTAQLYADQLARFEGQWSRVNDVWFSRDDLVRSFFEQLRAFARQVNASIASTEQGGFWDGWWESLGTRYVQILDGLPTGREVLRAAEGATQALPSILWAVVALAALYYLGPVARRS
jgi:hypothetical protein